MKAQFVLLLMISILISACSKPSSKRPSDFSLTLEWDTGALPPQYHYAYVIRIQPGSQADFTYAAGYEPLTQPDAWQAKFDLSESQLDALYAYLLGNDMLKSGWKTGQPLLGGSGTRILIQAEGTTYEIPSISILDKSQRQDVEALMDYIRDLVPGTIWQEMEERQAQHEADYENQS